MTELTQSPIQTLSPDSSVTGRDTGWLKTRRIQSVFQPVVSLSLQRIVGWEALTRDSQGKSLSELYHGGGQTALELDRASRTSHVDNFSKHRPTGEWLFLNILPVGQGMDKIHAELFREHLLRRDISPSEVVIEVVENHMESGQLQQELLAELRQQGFLLALDDFGAGHSNFERLWQMRPEIVKLDRHLITRARKDLTIRRALKGLCSLLHETGALVLMEGIETDDDALIAVDAGCDLLQGYFLASPGDLSMDRTPVLERTRQVYDHYCYWSQAAMGRSKSPYVGQEIALRLACEKLSAGISIAEATAELIRQERVERCYLLDKEGVQQGPNLINLEKMPTLERYLPMQEADGARWFHRPYFLKAAVNPGRLQLSRPYFSISSGRMCVTLSMGLDIKGKDCVFCCDLEPHS